MVITNPDLYHQTESKPLTFNKLALIEDKLHHSITTFDSSYKGVKDLNEPWHEISNNVVCVTSKASDQPANTRSLIRDFASRLHIL